MNVFVTGDFHGGLDSKKFKNKNDFFEQLSPNKEENVMIVCGDLGVVWDGSPTDKYWQDWLSEKPWITLSCLGNHENYDMIKQLPTVTIFGAQAYKVTDSIYFIKNGEVATIDNKTYLFIGGALSHDREKRVLGKTIWAEESCPMIDRRRCLYNLEQYDNRVNVVISHCAPTTELISMLDFRPDTVTDFLDMIYDSTFYDKWYCGHYHCERQKGDFIMIYNLVEKIWEELKDDELDITNPWEAISKNSDYVVNSTEDFFICGECDEPIYKEDWSPLDYVNPEVGGYVCPVCGYELLTKENMAR